MSHVPLLAFHFDSTVPQLAADLLLLVFIGLNLWLGMRKGLMRRLVAALGMFLGALAATYTGNSISTLLGPRDVFSNAWSFIGIYLLVIIVFEVLGALYHERLQSMVMVTFDRATGMVAGAVVGFLEVSIIFLVALAVAGATPTNKNAGRGAAADAINNGTLSEVIVGIKPGINALFKPVLPNDFSAHLSEGTQPTENPNQIGGPPPQ